MNGNDKTLDICVVGGGFAGLNSALLLGKSRKKCAVFTTGYGASNLWMGTFDFLNYNSNDIKESFLIFKREHPKHPYHFFEYKEISNALNQFFEEFQDVENFKQGSELINEKVLTSIGTLKPCLGIWSSLFYDFSSLNSNSNVILIGFNEFNNSALNLVQKGLQEVFKSNFFLLNLSFYDFYELLEGNDIDDPSKFKLSEFRLGRFFDSKYDKMEFFTKLILNHKDNDLKEISGKKIQFYLFPPILGINKNSEILHTLSTNLNSNCKELIALSPSLIANRLLDQYEQKLKALEVPVYKGKILTNIEKYDNNRIWKLDFEDRKGIKKTIKSKSVIFATGSMFQAGLFESEIKIKNMFEKLMITIPNDFDSKFQLIFDNEKTSTNLYVCGSALYNFSSHISDSSEIKYGTGLGLPIISSNKVVQSILNN
ncbi:MAG: hypothetical protein P8Y70_11630 [Candidatus Lokiarchaeota archaeon]